MTTGVFPIADVTKSNQRPNKMWMQITVRLEELEGGLSVPGATVHGLLGGKHLSFSEVAAGTYVATVPVGTRARTYDLQVVANSEHTAFYSLRAQLEVGTTWTVTLPEWVLAPKRKRHRPQQTLNGWQMIASESVCRRSRRRRNSRCA
jgi:hypothetical protein